MLSALLSEFLRLKYEYVNLLGRQSRTQHAVQHVYMTRLGRQGVVLRMQVVFQRQQTEIANKPITELEPLTYQILSKFKTYAVEK